ncbi:MAG: FAD binding domain-containing protein, partial [Pseudomonadota bacterium]
MMISVEKYNSLSEAADSVASGGRYYGGGTLVMRAVNYAEEGYDRLVVAHDPVLKEIRVDGNRLVIGAGVTMAEIVGSKDAGFLAVAARSIGGPAIRNAATVGGNLFAEHPYGDFTTALLALDATVTMSGGIQQDLEQFLSSRENITGIVQSVSCTLPDRGTFRFRKISRVKPKGISVMSIAAWLPQPGGRISNARIAFGAMGPASLRAKGAEQALEGSGLDETSADRAGAALSNDLQPFDDPIASAWYRRPSLAGSAVPTARRKQPSMATMCSFGTRSATVRIS